MSHPQIPDDVLGESTGIAMSQLLEAGRNGAGFGQLPVAAAEFLRERLAAEAEYKALMQARNGRDVCWVDEDIAEPLVSIRMATHNRCETLMEVALPSLLAQTYDNIEVVIVGDCTDDKTVRAISQVTDPRVRFINLPRPTPYPQDPVARWRVGGAAPMNLATELSRGAWITHCDDDDQFTLDHVEVLLREAVRQRVELVYSKTLMETPTGWQVLGTSPVATGNFTHGSVMWSAGLRFMKNSTTCDALAEPLDANLWRRMVNIGVKMGFVDAVTYCYFQSSLIAALEGPAHSVDNQSQLQGVGAV